MNKVMIHGKECFYNCIVTTIPNCVGKTLRKLYTYILYLYMYMKENI